ncbi:MAG: alpha-N-acetylglucosaminidase [Phycisphaeraceae bacterium]
MTTVSPRRAGTPDLSSTPGRTPHSPALAGPVEAVEQLLRRRLPHLADRLVLGLLEGNGEPDTFELAELPGGRVSVRGSSGIALASGCNWYLKHYAGGHVSWCGDQAAAPSQPARLPGTLRITTPYRWRYCFNYCTFGYSMAWWDWPQWEQQIDLMALWGINLPLAITGQEAIWQKVYRDLGLSDKEIGEFFSGPAYLAWSWMGNLDSWGGPLPQSWIDGQRQLQHRILARQRELGMTPVLPAFTGHVPPALRGHFPDARIKQLHNWAENFPGTWILDPEDPLFLRIGSAFVDAQQREFGTDHYYTCDSFNENSPPSNDPNYLRGIAQSIFRAMTDVDPEARWVMQGWLFFFNPDAPDFWQPPQIRALFDGVPPDHLLLLDLHSELAPVWQKTQAFYGRPWIWNILHNFGGNRTMFGNLANLAKDVTAALHDPARGDLVGMGLAPEGIEQNPVVYDLATDLFWRHQAPDIDAWLGGYVRRRYGQLPEPALEAWRLLEKTVYSQPRLPAHVSGSIMLSPPRLEPGPRMKLHYELNDLAQAWEKLAACGAGLRGIDSYEYDLVDVGRQVLAGLALTLHHAVKEAWEARDRKALQAAAKRYIELINDVDELLATRSEFLLGRWIESAKAWATNDQERRLYEWNARTQVTLWGNRQSMLRDYARKEWSGLLKDFYAQRWGRFFAALDGILVNGGEFDAKAFEAQTRAWEEQWAHRTDTFAAEPRGEALEITARLLAKYRVLWAG